MKKMLSVALTVSIIVIGIALFAAAQTKETGTPAGMPEANGKAFINYITKENPYKQWNLFPGTTKFYKGTMPHGVLLNTYVNQIAYDAINENRPFPDGSIIVKENYTKDKKLNDVTSMYKVAGYNPEAGDWFWVKSKPDGKTDGNGKMSMCIQCHAEAKGGDYAYTNDKNQ